MGNIAISSWMRRQISGEMRTLLGLVASSGGAGSGSPPLPPALPAASKHWVENMQLRLGIFLY